MGFSLMYQAMHACQVLGVASLVMIATFGQLGYKIWVGLASLPGPRLKMAWAWERGYGEAAIRKKIIFFLNLRCRDGVPKSKKTRGRDNMNTTYTAPSLHFHMSLQP